MKFYTATTQLPPYLPYPRFLLSMRLSETARLVYSLILSRIHLSQANNWVDSDGRVYCRYTIQELMTDTGKSKSTIVTALADLEAQGLLFRHREGTWNANKLYIRVPAANTSDDRKATPQKTGKPAPNKRNTKKNYIPDYNYGGDSL